MLTYLAAVNRKGAPITIEQLEAFAVAPRPRGPVVTNWVTRDVVRSISAMFEQVSPGEKMTSFLARVEWIEIQRGNVHLTPLGRAVLEEADRPVLADAADEPLSVTIDPDDPLAYTRIFHLLSGRGAGLLVDPYLKFEGLVDVMEISSIDRVLTSGDDGRNRLAIFARALGASTTPPVLKTIDRARLHDRFFIPEEGPVYALGSSLNSIARRPGVVTPIADDAASAAVRKAYAKLWREASEVSAMPIEAGGTASE